MKFTDYSPPSSPSLTQQADALQKGLGRAVQWARTGRLDHEVLLDACLHDKRYDKQCEEVRGEWLWTILQDAGVADRLQKPILQTLQRLPIEADAHQLCQLACRYALSGDSEAAGELYRFVERQPVADCPWVGEEQLLEAGGEDAFLFIARIPYSLWANGRDWQNYQDQRTEEAGCFLPTEAQWEYAARGARYQSFPWGDQPPSQDRMVYGLHRKSVTYEAVTLPLVDVNEQLGMSPFGLHHMAGNVWQWCRDWYGEDFYSKPQASEPNPENRIAGQVRSERGGSWIGPAELCRSSYRRGRPPHARGRCLGFQCVSSVADLP